MKENRFLRMKRVAFSLAVAVGTISCPAGAIEETHAETAGAHHPLDALTAPEIELATAILRRAGLVQNETRFVSLVVLEPPKKHILEDRLSDALPRRALATLKTGRDVLEVVVNLHLRTVEELKPAIGQPPITSADWQSANRILRSDPRWRAAMIKRGVKAEDKIYCAALSAGYFGEEGPNRRLVKLPCYDITGATTNLYDRPIEGLIATVDLDEAAVVEVIDTGTAPISTTLYHLDPDEPVRETGEHERQPTTSPQDFRRGNAVEWGPWSFHLRADPRLGPVLSLIRFLDGDVDRSVMYQGHLSELFVPYMSDDPAWYFRSYMDVGEYGFGAASELEPGVDCPAEADFIDVTLADEKGQPSRLSRAMCLFERAGAMPAWRHREVLTNQFAGRAGKELVLRSAPTLGNYDYIIDWIFTPSGEIRIEIGATGIVAVKGVEAKTAAEADLSEGALVAPNLLAVHHDHLFAFRFDLDIDGRENSLVVDRLTPAETLSSTPRQSLWRVKSEVVGHEGALERQGAMRWRMINPGVRTALGYHPGYQIAPGMTATSLLAGDDWPQRRAAYSGNTLWITRHHPGELYAAGAYPNQSRVDLGLTAFSNDEPIENADLVAWYTMGFHHVTRPEDWPVVSTMRRSVTLRPVAFFDANPAVAKPRPADQPEPIERLDK